MADLQLRVTLPDGSTPGALPPPDLTQAPRLTLEQWASASSDGAIVLAWGCVRGDVSQWSDDASELAQGKLVELAQGTLGRMGSPSPGLHVVATATEGKVLEQTLQSDGAARARAFVAFTRDPGQAHACVVVCADTTRCDRAVTDASVSWSGGELSPPPRAGLGLRALSAAVHHPHAALGVLVGAVFFAAVLAVATRPRPKRPDRG